ncbi:MAG: M48 family metallopeptidase [Bacteroidales bacterium]|jgi:STE24 endopeptidase|nr:M48 family metallopeptidase [Bacteroidales bacterium]
MLLYIIITIIVLDFLLEQYLNHLNRKMMTPALPEKLKGIYSEEEYARQQAYSRENSRLGLFSGALSFVAILLICGFGGFGWLDKVLRNVTDNFIWLPLLYMGMLAFASQLIGLPFSWYDTFVIEEKFGFNKSTRKLFISDLLKGLLLSAVIGGGILASVICIYQYAGEWFWVLAWGVITAFSVVMNMFYSEWIVPLFNKQTPLEEGELRTEIEDFCRQAGFKLNNIFVMDGSRRSAKANAYFSGLGKKKRIVLFDTLITELTTKEIVAVLAHEIGHYRKKHTLQGLVMSIISTGIALFILSLLLDNPALSNALGSDIPSFHLGLIGFSLLFAPISEITGLFFNMISRKNEYQADAFAAKFGLGEALGNGLKKISVKALSNLNPHPAYVFWHYSHPTLLQRLEKIS